MDLLHAHSGAMVAAPPQRTTRALASGLATALLAIVVAAAVAAGAGLAAGIRPHVEASDSMRPAMRAGDVVWLGPIAAAQARRGDVVAFAHPDDGQPMLHRVVRVAERSGRVAFTTRGDANSGVERWTVRRDATIGRYVGVRVPAVGRAAAAPRRVAPGLVALTALWLLWRIWR